MLRAEHRLSRAELAKQIGTNPQTVGTLERGDHYLSSDLVFRTCAVFDLSVEAVFSYEELKPMSSTPYRKKN